LLDNNSEGTIMGFKSFVKGKLKNVNWRNLVEWVAVYVLRRNQKKQQKW